MLSAVEAALAATPGASRWRLLPAPAAWRAGATADCVVVTDRAVLAITLRPNASRTTAEDAALDLADFHPGSAGMPVIPILLRAPGTSTRPQFPLPLAGAAPVVEATPLSLPGLFRQIARFPALGRDLAAWTAEGYAATPGLLDAACRLYADHDVAALRLAGASPDAIGRTLAAVRAGVGTAQATGGKVVIFVTGAPGAGKTLCGLDLAFEPGAGAAFLTGNPTLVHILRDALVRGAASRGLDKRAARRRVESVIQALPEVRDRYAAGGVPPERLLVIDEAQRCWTAAHAIAATRNRSLKLTDSEPGHLLATLERRPGWAALVCLLGGGQEIYDGEGGLAGWGEALSRRPGWEVHAPDEAAVDERQRLPPGLDANRSPHLHLATPIRSVGRPHCAAWVDAVLGDEPARAAALAVHGVPFTLTRSLDDLRMALRQRGSRSAALVASSTARRLRAEGLGAVLAHQDADVVSHWFLARWPDIRSSDALEVVGTEFAVQGLEFDRAGLCWDLDLLRGAAGWEARRFRASVWTGASAAARANRLNAYRVLLTRARHGTIIWVPRGSARDPTRDPARYQAIAAYLHLCGVPPLDAGPRTEQDAPAPPEPALL
ncbi:MAG: DNA/RNA helicase domain-containing protein [Acetobacteraceae bacterium]|nr:DNA/RNA helicase domain-containing protein [Acetobacteraceae bacterium]